MPIMSNEWKMHGDYASCLSVIKNVPGNRLNGSVPQERQVRE